MPSKANRIHLVSEETEKAIQQRLTLLTGKPYTNAAQTNIINTFKRFGWVVPSEARKGGKWI